MNLIKRIRRRIIVFRVNRALGTNLFNWQIEYIFDDAPLPAHIIRSRVVGKTMACVLRLLLNPKYNNSIIDPDIPAEFPSGSPQYYASAVKIARLYGESGVTPSRRRYFIDLLRETRRSLESAHIKVNNLTIRYK